jgi:hypothetical protein
MDCREVRRWKREPYIESERKKNENRGGKEKIPSEEQNCKE